MRAFETETAALAAVCELHNVAGCSTCNHVRGECDYGACSAPATASVVVWRISTNQPIERRPACSHHAPYMTAGLPEGVRAGVESDTYRMSS